MAIPGLDLAGKAPGGPSVLDPFSVSVKTEPVSDDDDVLSDVEDGGLILVHSYFIVRLLHKIIRQFQLFIVAEL